MLVKTMKLGKEERAACTSLDVAQTFGKDHYHVLEDIRNIGLAISSPEFTGLFYESSYTAANGKKNPMFVMARDGFTLLVMGYTGDGAMRYKLDYIAQFNAMEEALRGRQIEREKGIAVRQSLTKALQLSAEAQRMHGHAYSTYTNCVYRALFGMDAKKLRQKYGVGRQDPLRDCFTTEELAAVESMERLVSGLVDLGWEYGEIKAFLLANSGRSKLLAA